MKRIDAVVKVFKLEEIVERLRLIGVVGLTVAEVHGMSPSTEVQSVFHGQRYTSSSSPRYQLTIVVMDDDAVPVVNAIVRAGASDTPGDGIIVVSEVLDVVRIRTGETGAPAL
jgi:nitrogen regulatory protein P-II 1